MRRRALLAAGLALAAAPWAGVEHAHALGRIPQGGRLTMALPLSFAALDPHDPEDALAALFGAAIADPLYALDAAGAPYPALAEALPRRETGALVITLRPGLVSASGVALDGRAVVASIERARTRGADAWLAAVGRVRAHPTDARSVIVAEGDAGAAARALASPLAAILPRSFDPARPDGTGAFAARLGAGALTLTRNLRAARGAAFLDELTARAAPDLRESLRAFEAGRDSLGWLGTGLFGQQRGTASFDLGRAALVVLRANRELGAAGRPGALQPLIDGIARDSLAHLGLGALPAGGSARWPFDPTELWVDADSPQLVETARAIASALSAPGHEVTVRPAPRSAMAARRRQGDATLSLGVVRPFGPGPGDVLLSLASLDDPARARELARAAPRVPPAASARSLTSDLRLGVVGELRVAGGVLERVALAPALGGGWDLGASHLRRNP